MQQLGMSLEATAGPVQPLIRYYGISQKDVALKLGKTEQHISRLLAVFDLTEEVRQSLHAGEISLGHAVEFGPLRDAPQQQKRLLAEITERGLGM